MIRCVLVGLLLLFAVSCQNQSRVSGQNIETSNQNVETKDSLVSKTPEDKSARDEILENFSDDSKIGRPNKNKIELSNIKKSEGNIVAIRFYSLGENKDWQLKQTFESENYGIENCDPKLEDFNNDGLKDFTYHSAEAARGANEVRKLFIYDKVKDRLIYVKNSEDYPNLQYNKELNCLDAWLFHGGTTTVFLRIEGDLLKKFAGVNSSEIERTVYTVDKNGKEKILRKDKITEDDIYERYKNFNPLETYKDKDQ